MIRKPPIRTYQRKNKPESSESYWQSSKFTVPTIPTIIPSNDIVAINEERNEDMSLNDDPFDTTFDRLARNARLPVEPTPSDENSWTSSSSDVSEDGNSENDSLKSVSITLPTLEDELRGLLHNKRERTQTNVKKKATKKKYSRLTTRKPLIEKQNVASGSMIKVKKRLPKFSKRKAKKKEEEKRVNSSISTSLISNCQSRNSEYDDNVENMPPSKDTVQFPIQIRPCSVMLDNLNINKLERPNRFTKNGTKTQNGLHKEISKDIKANFRKGKASAGIESMLKKCFVKLEELPSIRDTKLSVDRRPQHMICSTPLSKCPKRPWDSLYVSPITINRNTLFDVFNNTNEATKSHESEEVHKAEVRSNKLEQQPEVEHNSWDKSIHSTVELSSTTQAVLDHQTSVESSKNENENMKVNYNHSDKFKSSSVCNEPVNETSPPKILRLTVTSDRSCSLFDDTKNNPIVSVNVTEIENSYDKTSSNLLMSDVSNRGQGNANNESCSIFTSDNIDEMSEISDVKNSHELTNHDYSVSCESLQNCQSSNNTTSIIQTQDEDQILVSEVHENEKDCSEGGTLSMVSMQRSEEETFSMVATQRSRVDTLSMVSTQRSEADTLSMVSTQRSEEDTLSMVSTQRSEADTLSMGPTQSSEDNETVSQRIFAALQDPIRVTYRRKPYEKRTIGLEDIFEISNDEDVNTEVCETESAKTNVVEELPRDMDHIPENSLKSVLEESQSTGSEKLLYLKPGKSWMRSLSILSNIHNGLDLDQASVGKGKKWSHSVKDILDMQRRGTSKNYLTAEEDEEEKENSCHDTINTDKFIKLVRKTGVSEKYTNTERISKRISVRVIPHNRTSKCIEDTSFLEAYGITSAGVEESSLRATGQRLTRNTRITNNIYPRKGDYAVNKDIVLERCEQENYLPFSEFFTESFLQNCRKIGEGVYGEVFLHENQTERSVIKIIPIEGDKLVNGEHQKKFGEILSEIVIAKELHNLSSNSTHKTNGFVEVKNVKCIIGKYPERLIELWNHYDEEKRSENDCPIMFEEDQLYIVLELAHGGQDLEAFVFNTAEEALSLFKQTVMALAVAEKAMEFEHRDLHWGNILISRTDESHVNYKIEDREFVLPTKGVKVSIIDFTLSRMSYGSCCIYNDLALDPALFTAQGDYQFEIYRLMKDKVENTWHKFEPYTNILWLHYVLDKMITAARYKKKTTKAHKSAIAKLKSFKNIILNYESSYDFIINSNAFTIV